MLNKSRLQQMFTAYLNSLNSIKFVVFSDVLFLIIAIILLIFTGSYIALKNDIYFAFSKLYCTASIYSFLIFLLLALNIPFSVLTQLDYSAVFSSYNIDTVTSKFSTILYLFTFIFFIILYAYISTNKIKTTFEYSIIILISFLGMLLILRSSDLFIWFLAIELQSFCFYTLAAYRTNRSYLQTEAGLKYFLFGSIASSLYLFGTSIIYLYTGTLNFYSILAISYFPIYNQFIFQISLLLIICSLCFKLGIAPFHFWLPIVYTYSSNIVCYLFILIPKIPLFFLLFRFSTIINNQYLFYIPLFLSLAIGTLFAFKASNVKTFLAYSSIANAAFFLVPVIYQNYYSISAFLFYVFSYSILITISFIPLLFLISFDNKQALVNLRSLIFLKKSSPILALFFVLVAFNFAGIPPLLGFFSKLAILLVALSSSAYLLVGLLLFFSIISGYYYLRIVKLVYFNFHLKYAGFRGLPTIPAFILSIFTLISALCILFPTYFIIIL